jgi:hypothetical protein
LPAEVPENGRRPHAEEASLREGAKPINGAEFVPLAEAITIQHGRRPVGHPLMIILIYHYI